MKLGQIRVDTDRERDGAWVPWLEDIELKIASTRSPRYVGFVRERVKALKREKGRRAQATDDIVEQVTKEGFAKHILLGWKNLQDDDETEILYNEEKALELLTDPRYRVLWEFVSEVAAGNADFAEELEEIAEGN